MLPATTVASIVGFSRSGIVAAVSDFVTKRIHFVNIAGVDCFVPRATANLVTYFTNFSGL
jgi:hypothetical protein